MKNHTSDSRYQEPKTSRYQEPKIGILDSRLSEPRFAPFGTMWVVLPQNTNGLRAIFPSVTLLRS